MLSLSLTLSLSLLIYLSLYLIYLSLSVSIYRLTVNPQRSQLTCPVYIGTAKWLTGGLAWCNWLISTNDSTNNCPSQQWHQGPRRFLFTWKMEVADFHLKIQNNSFFVIFFGYNFKFDNNKSRDMVQKGWKCIFDFSSALMLKAGWHSLHDPWWWSNIYCQTSSFWALVHCTSCTSLCQCTLLNNPPQKKLERHQFEKRKEFFNMRK